MFKIKEKEQIKNIIRLLQHHEYNESTVKDLFSEYRNTYDSNIDSKVFNQIIDMMLSDKFLTDSASHKQTEIVGLTQKGNSFIFKDTIIEKESFRQRKINVLLSLVTALITSFITNQFLLH